MLRTSIVVATTVQDRPLVAASGPRWNRMVLIVLLSGVLACLPARAHTAGLDCPEVGPHAVPDLLAESQVKLVTSGNSVDLANEIDYAINKLQIPTSRTPS
jgi:hypothetical protein